MALDVGVLGNLQQPNPLGMMGNIASTANAMQQFQSGAIAMQAQRQANVERQNLIQLFQNDPDAKPNADGTFKPAIYAKVLAAAPQTGQDMINKLATNNTAVTQANKAQFALGQEQNQQIADAFQDQRGKPMSSIVGTASDLKQKFPALGPRVDIMMNQLKGVDPNNQQAVDSIINHNMALTQTLAGRKEYTQPDYAVTPVGPVGLQTQRNPEAPGGVVSPVQAQKQPTVAMGVAPGYQVDQSGNLVQLPGFMPGGKGAAAAPKPAGALPPAPAWMNKQQAQNASDAQARWSSAQTRDVDPASGYNATAQVYSNLKDLLAKKPDLGPGSAERNKFLGYIGTATNHAFNIDPNANYQEVAGYLDRLSAQNSAATGAATNFAREQQASATGNPEVMGPTAIAEKLRFGASVNEASHAYASASRAFLTKQGPNAAYANPQLFEGAWSENADPVAFRLMAAHKDGDKADFAATQARVAAMPPEQQQAIHQHYLNLKNYLLKGQLPPNG